MSAKCLRVKSNGVIFVFKYEADHPELLHIYARHRKEPSDAVEVYFDAPSVWNPERKRFEAYTETQGIFWFWLDEHRKVVFVITCFDID
jgi:hypothetical protein